MSELIQANEASKDYEKRGAIFAQIGPREGNLDEIICIAHFVDYKKAHQIKKILDEK